MADVNITPDMIDNLVNLLKNNSTQNSKNKNENISSDNTTTSENSSSFGNLDFDTIMKIKSIMESLNNKNDRDSNLLYSLKPYLRKSKQTKLEQYINILKISQISKLFKNDLGDDK